MMFKSATFYSSLPYITTFQFTYNLHDKNSNQSFTSPPSCIILLITSSRICSFEQDILKRGVPLNCIVLSAIFERLWPSNSPGSRQPTISSVANCSDSNERGAPVAFILLHCSGVLVLLFVDKCVIGVMQFLEDSACSSFSFSSPHGIPKALAVAKITLLRITSMGVSGFSFLVGKRQRLSNSSAIRFLNSGVVQKSGIPFGVEGVCGDSGLEPLDNLLIWLVPANSDTRLLRKGVKASIVFGLLPDDALGVSKSFGFGLASNSIFAKGVRIGLSIGLPRKFGDEGKSSGLSPTKYSKKVSFFPSLAQSISHDDVTTG
uniref:Uncharacterized protein n=1 Tax=Glossina pallidipes TaxID=7398 RepID=A0A1A9ZBH3_GLOPL